MSMLSLSKKKEMAPPLAPSITERELDIETASIMETIVATRNERDDLKETLRNERTASAKREEQLRSTIDGLQQRLEANAAQATHTEGFLRTELAEAQRVRDFFYGQYRAMFATFKNSVKTLTSNLEQAETDAAAQGIRPPQRTEPQLADDMAAEVGRHFGANNRDDASDETEASRG
jgi:hypothetical protein